MNTKRPTNPAAEEILGGYFPVLDHGFVALVDYMGSDDSVERAARVSYGYGTRKTSQTRGLIRYLRRHRHTTPSEMVEFKFHCCMPMFVARQWIRHRTACLARGTEVYFDLPGGVERRGNQLYKVKIEDLWERFQPTRNRHRPDKQRSRCHTRERIRGMRLRQIDEHTGRVQHTRVVDVFESGVKPVFRMVLADGKEICSTADHKFLFADGWSTVADQTGLREVGGEAVWGPGDYYVHVNGVVREAPPEYRDREWLNEQYNVLRRTLADIAAECDVTTHTIRKWLRSFGIQDAEGRGRFQSERERASGERYSIGRWTTQVAAKVHRANGWTCQLCGERAKELHCHHVVPVWADIERARDVANLTTLCGDCHRSIAGRELEYVAALGGPPIRAEWRRRPRTTPNRLEFSKLVRVERFEYIGEVETYDLEVEGPFHNFIANGIVTHNSVNEYSGRYSLMPLLFYRPDREHFALQSPANNQGRQEAPASGALFEEAIGRWDRIREQAAADYTWMVAEDVAREIARIDLPLSTYTQWYWKIDLHNLLHFLSLRADPHAQYEIRAYADIMAGMVKRVAPLSYEAWVDYDLMGQPFSRGEIAALAQLVSSDDDGIAAVDGASLSNEALTEAGLSGREVRELKSKLGASERPDFELDLSTMRSAEDVGREMSEAVPDPDV